MLDKTSSNVAEVIPYETFREKIELVARELKKNRHVEVWNELKVIYSAEKWRWKNG